MDHILKTLDEHIAYLNWRLKCEIAAREALEKELEAVKKENAALKAQPAPSLSRAEYDKAVDAHEEV